MIKYGQHGETLDFDGLNIRFAASLRNAWDAFSQLFPSPLDAVQHFSAGYIEGLEPAMLVVANGITSIRFNSDPKFQAVFDNAPQSVVDSYAAALVTHFGTGLRIQEWRSTGVAEIFLQRFAQILGVSVEQIATSLNVTQSDDSSPLAKLRNQLLAEFGDGEIGDGSLTWLLSQGSQRRYGGGTGIVTETVANTFSAVMSFGGSEMMPIDMGDGTHYSFSRAEPALRIAAMLHHNQSSGSNELPDARALARIAQRDIPLPLWDQGQAAADRWKQSIQRPRFSKSRAEQLLGYNRWHKQIIDRQVDLIKQTAGVAPAAIIREPVGNYFGTLTEAAQAIEEPPIWWMSESELAEVTAAEEDTLSSVNEQRIDGRHGEMFYLEGIEPRFAAAFQNALEAFADEFPIENDALRQVVSTPFTSANFVEVRSDLGGVVPSIAINNDPELQRTLSDMDDRAVVAFAKAQAIAAGVRVRLADIERAQQRQTFIDLIDGRIKSSVSIKAISNASWIDMAQKHDADQQVPTPVRKERSLLLAEFGRYERADVSLADLIVFSVQRSFAGGTGPTTKAVVAAFAEAINSGLNNVATADEPIADAPRPTAALARMIATARDQSTSVMIPQDALDAASQLISTWKQSQPATAEGRAIAHELLRFSRWDHERAMDAALQWAATTTLSPSVYQAPLPPADERPPATRFGQLSTSARLERPHRVTRTAITPTTNRSEHDGPGQQPPKPDDGPGAVPASPKPTGPKPVPGGSGAPTARDETAEPQPTKPVVPKQQRGLPDKPDSPPKHGSPESSKGRTVLPSRRQQAPSGPSKPVRSSNLPQPGKPEQRPALPASGRERPTTATPPQPSLGISPARPQNPPHPPSQSPPPSSPSR